MEKPYDRPIFFGLDKPWSGLPYLIVSGSAGGFGFLPALIIWRRRCARLFCAPGIYPKILDLGPGGLQQDQLSSSSSDRIEATLYNHHSTTKDIVCFRLQDFSRPTHPLGSL